MKKIFTQFILICFILVQTFSAVSAAEKLPDLPNLPPEFDTVLPPDGVDVFSPSTTPSQVTPSQPAKTTTAQPEKTAAPQKQAVTQPKKSSLTPVKTVDKTTTVQSKNNSYSSNTSNEANTFIVPKGKKFHVRLQTNISSSTPSGSRVSFVNRYPETSKYITIPSGTVFKGRVSDSHPPQLTGNGGLIVINVDQMVYNGRTYEIDAKISVANDKHIFFNNIKGKRMYLRSIPKSIKPGANFFKKMWRKTKNLARNENGIEIILTPFTLVTGTVVYVVNLVSSPVLALFYKGKSITIPSGTLFTIQLREDAVIRK